MADLIKLGEKLAKEGPHKKEATPRRVRGLFAGEWIFDTLKAVYVWEHPYYPYFYIPHSEFKKDVLKVLPESQEHKDSNTKGFHLARLEAGSQFTSRVLLFNTPSLDNLIRIEHSAITWFSEDEHLLGPHPKDPYKRVETLPSSRTIRIEFDGTVVAESSQNVFLFETMLRPRYYLNPGNVKWELLEESETVSYCPYKGMANYYNLKVNGKETKDAV